MSAAVVRLPDATPRPRRVAVGTFDGVHLAHREVIRGSDTVVTFEPHPDSVVHPATAPRLLTSLQRKAQIVGSLGVSELVVVPFDLEFAARGPQEFIDDILVRRLGATHVSVGQNFRFGNQAAGTTQMLEADPRFTTRVVPMLEADGAVVSSSHIRGLIGAGHMEGAAELLGEPFVLSGEVVHGEERGRTIGYPTANLEPDPRFVTPPHGVYACVANGTTPAAVNIGVRPTFVTALGELVEAFLIDFTGDLYGSTLDLAFLHRLRGEERFDSVDALVEQMERDVTETRRIAAQRGRAAA
jgi:riboflavin kinase/FMN adenylyltransferase